MASTIQIVPKFSFPYVETYVNDYTEVIDTLEEQLPQEPIVRYVFPFISSKGVDNVFIRKRTRGEIVKSYGDSAFSKYGQPLMQVLHVAESPNAEIFCMRVMPDDATYANSVIGVKAVGDKTSTGDSLLNRKVFLQQLLHMQKLILIVLIVAILITLHMYFSVHMTVVEVILVTSIDSVLVRKQLTKRNMELSFITLKHFQQKRELRRFLIMLVVLLLHLSITTLLLSTMLLMIRILVHIP